MAYTQKTWITCRLTPFLVIGLWKINSIGLLVNLGEMFTVPPNVGNICFYEDVPIISDKIKACSGIFTCQSCGGGFGPGLPAYSQMFMVSLQTLQRTKGPRFLQPRLNKEVALAADCRTVAGEYLWKEVQSLRPPVETATAFTPEPHTGPALGTFLIPHHHDKIPGEGNLGRKGLLCLGVPGYSPSQRRSHSSWSR